MTNLLLYVEARESLDQLHEKRRAGGGPILRNEHPLAYPEELFDELKAGRQTAPAHDRWLEVLFDGRLMPHPEYAH